MFDDNFSIFALLLAVVEIAQETDNAFVFRRGWHFRNVYAIAKHKRNNFEMGIFELEINKHTHFRSKKFQNTELLLQINGAL